MSERFKQILIEVLAGLKVGVSINMVINSVFIVLGFSHGDTHIAAATNGSYFVGIGAIILVIVYVSEVALGVWGEEDEEVD